MAEAMSSCQSAEQKMSETETYLGPDGKRYAADVERTPEGLQLMLGGVKPQSMKDKLDWLIDQPMQPRKQQKSYDIGLFDTERRNQLELF
jgi:hypothetical protein